MLLKRSCIMLVYESMDAWISICIVAKSSIHCLSCSIPSAEFSPTNSPEDEGKLFVHSNPLEQVHIIYMGVTKLSLAERLILLHQQSAMDGNVVAVHGHRNIIVCKIADQPPPPGLVQWRHEGQRPCRVLWSITGAWARASVGWAKRECLLHSAYQFLHPAQQLQQQHTRKST
jgi:hypothetical protein